jgi:hypothetical protein
VSAYGVFGAQTNFQGDFLVLCKTIEVEDGLGCGEAELLQPSSIRTGCFFLERLQVLRLAGRSPATQFPFYNAVFLNEHLTDAQVLRNRAEEAAAYMRGRPNGGLFVQHIERSFLKGKP